MTTLQYFYVPPEIIFIPGESSTVLPWDSTNPKKYQDKLKRYYGTKPQKPHTITQNGNFSNLTLTFRFTSNSDCYSVGNVTPNQSFLMTDYNLYHCLNLQGTVMDSGVFRGKYYIGFSKNNYRNPILIPMQHPDLIIS